MLSLFLYIIALVFMLIGVVFAISSMPHSISIVQTALLWAIWAKLEGKRS